MKKYFILILLFFTACCFSEEFKTLYDKIYDSSLAVEEHISLYEEAPASDFRFSLWTDSYFFSTNISTQYRIYSNNKEVLMKLLLTLEENRSFISYQTQFTKNILKSGNYKLFDEKILTEDNVIYHRYYYELNE